MFNLGYEVQPSFTLPKGYKLREDEDFLYLIRDSKRIAVFNAGYATPYEINKTIKDYEEMKGV